MRYLLAAGLIFSFACFLYVVGHAIVAARRQRKAKPKDNRWTAGYFANGDGHIIVFVAQGNSNVRGVEPSVSFLPVAIVDMTPDSNDFHEAMSKAEERAAELNSELT